MDNSQNFVPATPAMPLPSGITLGTIWTAPTPPPIDVLENINSIGMAEDGTIFLGIPTGLCIYSQSTKSWKKTASNNFVNQLAVVNADLVYIFYQDLFSVSSVDAEGNVTVLPSLPNSNTVAGISANKDGLLWAYTLNGGIYSFNATSKTWTAIDTGGYNIKQVSVGNANFAYAMANGQNGTIAVYYDGTSWQVDANFNNVPIEWIGAAHDGTAWATMQSSVFRKLPGLSWTLLKSAAPATLSNPAIGNPTQLIVAMVFPSQPNTSTNYPYNSLVLKCLQAGLTDNAPTPWPAMNSDETIGYQAISAQLGQTGTGGLRSAYTNTDNPFSDWYMSVQLMKMPEGIQNPDNWTSIQNQISTELEYVTSVNKLFENINVLTQDVAIDNLYVLDDVGDKVGLTVTDNPGTTVGLILSGLFFGVLGAIDNVLPPPANWIVTLVSSGLSTGLSVMENAGGLETPPNYALQVALGQISNTMSDLFIHANTANGQYQTAILQDWGMLSFAGNAAQHQWAWSPETSSNFVAQGKPVFKTFFYQSLIPARWKTVYSNWGYSSLGPVGYVPQYDAHYEGNSPNEDNFDKVFFLNGLEAPVDLTKNTGPYPGQPLFDDLQSIPVSLTELYHGYNGWENITRVEGNIN